MNSIIDVGSWNFTTSLALEVKIFGEIHWNIPANCHWGIFTRFWPYNKWVCHCFTDCHTYCRFATHFRSNTTHFYDFCHTFALLQVRGCEIKDHLEYLGFQITHIDNFWSTGLLKLVAFFQDWWQIYAKCLKKMSGKATIIGLLTCLHENEWKMPQICDNRPEC